MRTFSSTWLAFTPSTTVQCIWVYLASPAHLPSPMVPRTELPGTLLQVHLLWFHVKYLLLWFTLMCFGGACYLLCVVHGLVCSVFLFFTRAQLSFLFCSSCNVLPGTFILTLTADWLSHFSGRLVFNFQVHFLFLCIYSWLVSLTLKTRGSLW